MAFIQIDFNNAEAQAKKLDQAAAECQDAIRAIQKEYAKLEHSWQGDSGDAMKEKLSETLTKLIKTKAQLEQIAANIRSVAKSLLEHDQESAEKVKKAMAGLGSVISAVDKFF